MKNILTLLFAIAAFAFTAHTQNTWVQKSDIGYDTLNIPVPPTRTGAVGFSIADKGYIGTGGGYGFFTSKDFWEYDPATDTWTQKADFGGTARASAVGFSIGDKGYIGTGDNGDDYGNHMNDFWEYDPATNIWTQKADFEGTARSCAVGFNIGDKGYIGTGDDGDGFVSITNDFWEYDPATDTWTQKADLGGAARYLAAGFSIGDKGYIGTGGDSNEFGSLTNDFWEYDPATDTWTQKADFGGTARSGAVGFSIEDKGYLGTGRDVFNNNDFWEYDPVADIWTQKVDFGGIALSSAVGFSIADKGYLGTGMNIYGNESKDFWEYDPIIDIWTQKADFGGTARIYAVGFSIADKGYIGTGWDGTFMNDFWEYDPAADTWTQKADFAGDGRFGAVGFSIEDKGYIGTGKSYTYYYKKDFWEYDPATNTWTQRADFGGSERYNAVGFSIANKGYIGTGYDLSDGHKIDFWEYNTATDTWTQKADFGGTARHEAVGFSIGDKGYLGTGHDNTYHKTNDFWEYNAVTDTWTQKADFGGTARYVAVGFSIEDKGYLGTGDDGAIYGTNDFWAYDPATNSWTRRADFEGSYRYGAVGFGIAEKGYIGGSFFEKDFWEYTPGIGVGVPQTESGDFQLSLFPNPTDGNLTIELTLLSAQQLQFKLFDVLGREVYTSAEETLSGNITRQLDLNHLPSGPYLLKVMHGEVSEMRWVCNKQ